MGEAPEDWLCSSSSAALCAGGLQTAVGVMNILLEQRGSALDVPLVLPKRQCRDALRRDPAGAEAAPGAGEGASTPFAGKEAVKV